MLSHLQLPGLEVLPAQQEPVIPEEVNSHTFQMFTINEREKKCCIR